MFWTTVLLANSVVPWIEDRIVSDYLLKVGEKGICSPGTNLPGIPYQVWQRNDALHVHLLLDKEILGGGYQVKDAEYLRLEVNNIQ